MLKLQVSISYGFRGVPSDNNLVTEFIFQTLILYSSVKQHFGVQRNLLNNVLGKRMFCFRSIVHSSTKMWSDRRTPNEIPYKHITLDYSASKYFFKIINTNLTCAIVIFYHNITHSFCWELSLDSLGLGFPSSIMLFISLLSFDNAFGNATCALFKGVCCMLGTT